MIRRDDAPARAIGGPSRAAKFQRLQAAAAIKLQVFLGLDRCCQRAFLLLNRRAKRGLEHFDPGRLSPDRHPLRVPASFAELAWRAKQNLPAFPCIAFHGVRRGERGPMRSKDLSLITGLERALASPPRQLPPKRHKYRLTENT